MDHPDITGAYLREPGVEIGAFRTPIPGIAPTYVDRFPEFAGQKTLADFYGDACELPFLDSSLRYVASSHVIEHVANPLSAIKEWHRVLRHGGIIYAVVPDRRKTFDRPRALTEPGHILSDYLRNATQVDGEHIDDFCLGVDWGLYRPGGPADTEAKERQELARVYREAIAAGLEINIHFHTFQPESFAQMIELGNCRGVWGGRVEVVAIHEDFPTSNQIGFLVVARVHKPLRQRISALFSKAGLMENTRKFP